MTQQEARNAVIQIKVKLFKLKRRLDFSTDQCLAQEIIDEVHALECRLNARQKAEPNCRRATQEEFDQLCQASNVVIFPAAA